LLFVKVLFIFVYANQDAMTKNKIIKLFADDINLFFSIVNQKANECINELHRWFILNKTCYMVFTAKCDDNVKNIIV
jgi:hypothetical protein